MSATTARRSRVLWWGVVALVISVGGLGLSARSAARQAATPEATPVATAGVPCTTLFGIEDPTAGCVLVINAAPDAGLLDVYIDGTLALPAVDYGILGDFVLVAAGEREVQVTPAGGDPAAALLDQTVSIESGVAYEVAAVGLAADLQLLTLPVNTIPPAPDAARIRVVHAAPDAGAVDFALTGGEVLAPGLDYLALSPELEIPAGPYVLEARAEGADEVVVPIGDAVLDGSVTYTIYLIGLVADNTVGGFVVPVALPQEVAAPDAAATPVP